MEQRKHSASLVILVFGTVLQNSGKLEVIEEAVLINGRLTVHVINLERRKKREKVAAVNKECT